MNTEIIGRFDYFLNAMTFGYYKDTRFYIIDIMRF